MKTHFPSVKSFVEEPAINGMLPRQRCLRLIVIRNGHHVPYTLSQTVSVNWLKGIRDRIMSHARDGVVVGVHWDSLARNILYYAQEGLLAAGMSEFWLRSLLGPYGLYLLVADSRVFGPDPALEDQPAILQQIQSTRFESIPTYVDVSNIWTVLIGAYLKQGL